MFESTWVSAMLPNGPVPFPALMFSMIEALATAENAESAKIAKAVRNIFPPYVTTSPLNGTMMGAQVFPLDSL